MNLTDTWRDTTLRTNRLICDIVGHSRKYGPGSSYLDRRGRLRYRTYAHCTRCHTSDGSTVYTPGLIEHLAPGNVRSALFRIRRCFTAWMLTKCPVCHLPNVCFGRSVGHHVSCDDGIPF